MEFSWVHIFLGVPLKFKCLTFWEKLRTFSYCWIYDSKNVFVFALHIYPFHLMLQNVSFRVMKTSIVKTPRDISFYWKDGALEKLCLRAPKNIIGQCSCALTYVICTSSRLDFNVQLSSVNLPTLHMIISFESGHLFGAYFVGEIYTLYIGGSRICFRGGAQGRLYPDVYWLHSSEDPTAQVIFFNKHGS